jgi:hypothetical protein
LRWKFEQGASLNCVLSQESVATINAEGIEFQIKSAQTLDLLWHVQSVAEDGTAQLAQQVERIRLAVSVPQQGGAQEFSYDSQTGEPGTGPLWERLGPVLTALPGEQFTMRVSPIGAVSDIALPEKVATALAQRSESRSLFGSGSVLTEEGLRQTIEASVLPLPAGAVSPGDTWSKPLERPLPRVGKLTLDLTYTYHGRQQQAGLDLAHLALASQASFTPQEASGLNIKLEIIDQKGSGQVLFDPAAGRTQESTFQQNLTLDGELMGNGFTQEIETTIKLKLTPPATLPAE